MRRPLNLSTDELAAMRQLFVAEKDGRAIIPRPLLNQLRGVRRKVFALHENYAEHRCSCATVHRLTPGERVRCACGAVIQDERVVS